MIKLGVNIDHIATLREARRGIFPDPASAAGICENAGCDSIVAHLREDRRHINELDIKRLKKTVRTKFNMEMSIAEEIVDIACGVKPDQATLVPEKREELTTEGGIDLIANRKKLKNAVKRLITCGIEVSLFIDPDKRQINEVPKLGVKIIEINTGQYSQAKSKAQASKCLKEIIAAANYAKKLGLIVSAGHGLDYHNVCAIAAIKGINELNIGYSIICRSVFVGLKKAVQDMRALLK